jgi:Mg-chelatase subunit ChlD
MTETEMSLIDTDKFRRTCEQLCQGVSKMLHRNVSITFTEGGGTYTINGKHITYNLNFPLIKSETDMFALLHHELAHIVFKSDMRYAKKLFAEFPDVNEEGICTILNIVEDVRIEHAWGKLYPGHYNGFLGLRDSMIDDEDKSLSDNPLWVLLQIRAGNDNIRDMASPKLKNFVDVVMTKLNDVRNNSAWASVIVTKEIIVLLNAYFKDNKPECIKCGKKLLKNKSEREQQMHYGAGLCGSCAEEGDDDGEPGDGGSGNSDGSGGCGIDKSTYPTESFNKQLDKLMQQLDKNKTTIGCNGTDGSSRESSINQSHHPFQRLRALTADKIDGELKKSIEHGELTVEQEKQNAKMRQLKQKAIRHMMSKAKKDSKLLDLLKENLKEFGGEHQEEIGQYQWDKSEHVEPRKSWIGKVRTITGNASYSRKKKLHSSGFKLKMSKAITYIASGQNATKRNIFLRKNVTGKELSMCYVVDMSSSMYGMNERIAKQIMLTTDFAVRDIGAITMDYIVFQSSYRARIKDTRLLHTIGAGGGTYASPAIIHGANILNHAHAGKEKILIFISDGDHEEVERCMDYCKARDITPLIVVVNEYHLEDETDKSWIADLYGEEYIDNVVSVVDYETAFDYIMTTILSKIKKVLEKK